MQLNSSIDMTGNSVLQSEPRFKKLFEYLKRIKSGTEDTSHSEKFALAIMLRIVFLLLAVLSFTGLIDAFMSTLGWGRVFASAHTMMDESLRSAVSNTIVLTVVKGAAALVQSSTMGFMGTSLSIGQAINGFSELIDFLFRFFLVSSGLIAAQIALLNFIELIGISIIGGIGLLCLSIQPGKETILGRMGRLLVIMGFVLYLLFPAMISVVGLAYRTQQVNAEIQNKENIAVVSQRASEISFKSMASQEGRDLVKTTFSDGILSIWDGFMSLLISYILMFVFLPLVSLFFCYLVIRQTMQGLGFGDQVLKMDDRITKTSEWIRKGKKLDTAKTPKQFVPATTI